MAQPRRPDRLTRPNSIARIYGATQPYRVEVWDRKRRIGRRHRGLICNAFRVPYFSCTEETCRTPRCTRRASGFAAWMGEIEDTDQWPIILHLGDHDPAGLDMTRDIERRLWAVFAQPLARCSAWRSTSIRLPDCRPTRRRTPTAATPKYVKRYGTTVFLGSLTRSIPSSSST